MKLIRSTGSLLLLTFATLILDANPTKTIFSEEQILDLLTDYFRKEKPQCHICELRFIEDESSTRIYSASDLESYGFEHDPHGCIQSSGSITLSIEKRVHSDQMELRTVEEGTLCLRKIWYYPVVYRDSSLSLENLYEGEIITFEIQQDGAILLDRRDIGLGGVQVMTRQIVEKKKGPIRASVVVEESAPKQLELIVREEILAADPSAHIIVRYQSHIHSQKETNEQNKAVDTTAANARLSHIETSELTNPDVVAMTGAAVVSP